MSVSSRQAQRNRLREGGLVDRSKPISFRFDGRDFQGFSGDTLASALLANGQRLIGRSFKYHRPRGIMTAGSEEPNALVELRNGARREPNTRATTAELFEGLEAKSQNRWPSLGFDILAVNSALSPLIAAGFYYKTFMWPAVFWEKVYEPLIRRAAGLGRASLESDPDSYEKAHAFCDLLVIGGGPAGLSAALAAGRAGARVIVCDEDFLLGGRLNSERYTVDDKPGAAWAQQVVDEIAAQPGTIILTRTNVFGAYDGGVFGAIERVADHSPEPGAHQPRQRYWRIAARRAILAAGAIERPLVFGGNDRPGVMTASAVRTYLNRFGTAAGRRVAVFANNEDGWRTADDLIAAGITVSAVILPALVEPRSQRSLSTGQIFSGARVIATRGWRGLESVVVRHADGQTVTVEADVLAVSGGWNPAIGLCSHLGDKPTWSPALAAFVPGKTPAGMRVAGAAAGVMTLGAALSQGAAAGAEVAAELGRKAAPWRAPKANDEPSQVTAFWRVADSLGKAFVDFQNDVTTTDIELAVREGFRHVELLKRYTTLGMATDQGKTSGLNGLAILAELSRRPIGDLGAVAPRPPTAPVTLGVLAGRRVGSDFRPTRLTPGHSWAIEQGATFVESGDWLRAQYFARRGETDWLETVAREVRAVREQVGVCDVSTLGKIDVQGQEAARFLDLVYANTFSNLPIGQARYGLMLREDGIVFDDGVGARFAADHFAISTTTANAGRVFEHLEFCRQVLWPELDVQIASVTEQWAQYSVAGPRSRELLRRLFGQSLDLSNAALPFMAARQFAWRGVTIRLFRVSFSGELAYELAAPARYGRALICAIAEAGRDLGLAPYGLEALSTLRIEKGHVAGPEINGTTTAGDLGLGRLLSRKKDFVGRVLANRPGLVDPARQTLVGLKPVDRSARLRAGAHLLPRGAALKIENDQGHVTSVAFSPMLGHWIALGLLSYGRERIGERILACDPLR
ncbi:MAG TPA: sarcosine oxidase subunit alpha family protein, partial [Roseiarcus sp.]|nr:sarcosine oxidase subunit alpha family protein [Roseiarcus sp.]